MDTEIPRQIREAFEQLQAGRWKMAATAARERVARLERLRDALLAQRDDLCAAIHQDYGKHAAEVELTETYPVVAEINHTVAHLASWMEPTRAATPLALTGTRSEVRYEPRGLVLVLAPWNYPFQLLINPLVAALAAGNCVAVRPSSKVPATARFIERFLGALFPPDEVAVFGGDHRVSDALLALPFDHIFFTGSTRVGRKVMAAAAQHLASVTLELGGKSPAIVDRSADVQKASERILWGKLINAGQTCVAPDYVLVHRDRHDAFLEACQRVLDQRFGADEEARAESPHLCRLVSEGHHTGLQRLLDDAIASGARVVTGGTSRPKERYLSPTILTEVRPEMAVMQEEIFGPILPVLAVDSVDEAIAFVRARPKPLALYAFARDQRAVARLLSETSAGGSCVNTTILHLANAELPFGGVGESGMGSYHGRAGFLTCSHARSVLTQGCLDGTRSFYPPYGDKGLKLIRRAIRFLV